MTHEATGPRMHLTVRTPTEVVVDEDVRALTAEDGSGRFGVRPRGEPLLAALVPGVLTYRRGESVGEDERFVAIGSGVLSAGPDRVDVAVRDAVACESLEGMREEMLAQVRTRREGELAMQDVFRSMHRRFLKTLADEERRP